MAFKIGFGAPNKNKKPVVKSKPLFGDDEEDAQPVENGAEEVGGLAINQLGSSKPKLDDGGDELLDKPKLKAKPRAGQPISQYGDLSAQRTNLATQKKALNEDAAIFDYDAAYDAIHAKDNERKAQRKKEAEERKSKYMDSFIASAEVRKQDLARAKDKQIQREREAEGDMYADKEQFVTGAYKKQQEELRKAEEDEKKRQEAEEEKRKASGMQGFYKGVMDEQEKRYQEAVQAAEEATKSGKTFDSELEKEKTDAQVAEELRAQGKDVLVNEDGQIVDKRETLTAGLNIVKKPKAGGATIAQQSQVTIQPAWQAKKAGDQKAMRERQTKMMEEQLAAAAKRQADDEAEEQRKLEHASKSRKTEGDISSAKERFLARKRAAEEAKKAKSNG